MKKSKYFVTICFRLLLLTFYSGLRLCSGDRKIVMNFDCMKGVFYFKCTNEGLKITANDKNATIIIEEVQQQQQPQELVINSSMFFIPPEIFNRFNDVREFIARNTSIEEIYFETFGKASELRYLILSHNKIKILTDFPFSNATYLQSLKLQNNEISSISSFAFFGLTELRALILSFNRISNLPLHLFRSLESLDDLHLDNNFIKIISFDQFAQNLELTTLNFDHNDISFIDNNTFAHLKKLESLNLNNNICVDKRIVPWKSDVYKELKCCSDSILDLEECAVIKAEQTFGDHELSPSHVPLIFLLFFSIFLNIVGISYCVIYRRNANRDGPIDNMELITSDLNGEAYQVY
ncbi:CLUMA_CG016387, isoform A [Clunio marinus]|uniref:CLUMA_CG016387, isoform A n=1 Tax=Clunio marinus TaxID=568069 RepID=A0A1J1IST5_9DIPT|nr:CLUMA_CG016387, isoform A [Clunio marinus]